MLLEFSIANFLSFKEPATFSMVASNVREYEETNVFDAGKRIRLLSSSVVYGANASGKSNLFKAIMVLLPIQADRKLMELPDRELPDIMAIA